MQNFKELLIWKKSTELAVFVYELTKKFPTDEKYGLITQMRRSAVSIPSNIAEGHMRNTDKDFRQFIAIARGSCAELETQSRIAYKLNYFQAGTYQVLEEKIEEIAKMLSSFYSKLSS